MDSYNIEFTVDDVIRKLEEVRAMNNAAKKDFFTTFTHEESRLYLNKAFKVLLEPIVLGKKEGRDLWNDTQKELIRRINDAFSFKDNSSISNFLSDGEQSFQNYQVPPREMIEQYVEKIIKASEFFPIYDQITSLGNSSEWQNERLKIIDLDFHMFLFYVNRIFSPDSSNREIYLHSDVGNFVANMLDRLSDSDFYLRDSGFDKIRTHADYVTNVIFPLVSNAIEHAFNPDNNIYKLLEPDNKRIYIHGHHIEYRSGREYYKVVIEDNGSGIHEEVALKVMSGYSTKPEDGEKHGIGLSEAVNYVRRHGGDFILETELGIGTTIIFTIPIIKGQSEPYIQAPIPETKQGVSISLTNSSPGLNF
jgi:signal transduction histidine kinase